MPRLLFPNGVATDNGSYVVAQVIADDGNRLRGSLIIDYQLIRDPECFATDWTAVSICLTEPDGAAIVAGENGEILRIADELDEESIGPQNDGPIMHGPIREVRSIGRDLFAVGMGRQVYRRRSSNHWEHLSQGIIDQSKRPTIGFTSICGDGQGHIVAVGYEGEIWEFQDEWTRVDSPSNVLLNRVVLHSGKYYAAGQVGTVICREQYSCPSQCRTQCRACGCRRGHSRGKQRRTNSRQLSGASRLPD